MNLSIPLKWKASPWLNRDRATSAKRAAAPQPAPAVAKAAPTSRPLPFIGRWPVARQFKALLGLLLLFLVLAALFVFIDIRQAAQTSIAISTATEMQMLSQRVANTAQRAARGNPTAFGQLLRSRNRFTNDLELLTKGGRRLGESVDPAPQALRPELQALNTFWNSLQRPINRILSQRGHLLDLKQEESTIEKTVPQLGLLAQGLLISASDAQEAQRTLTYVRQLAADVSNYDFADALRLLSTDDPHDQTALQLDSNVREFERKLNALLGMARDDVTLPITDPAVKRRAEALNRVFTPFASSVQLIVANMHGLALAKQSSRELFDASEALLKAPVGLVAAYQQIARTQIYYVIGATVCALLALAALVLLGKVFLDDAQRRAIASEAQNRRNQDAILRLLDEMAQIADGNLTVQARVSEDVTGAIADSVNYTIEELRRLVAGITRAAAQVSAATVDAQRVTGQLLEASQNQAARIQSTGQSVAKMVKAIGDVSENAGRSADVAQQSLMAAEHGAAAVQKAVRGMNDIREQIQETSKRIKRLGESSQEIGEIVQLITEITEQTNVLALNAAIQAASAGEAGRGFTVVAEEVQRLAERSAEATKHISSIVKTIQRDTHDTAQAMEHSTQGVVDGTRIADEAGQALREIEDVSKRLASLIASISKATQAQTQSAVEIEANMQSILRITELTSEGTKKTTASAAQLHALANDLKNSVARFKLA